MSHTLVLGAGFGGLTCALELADLAPEGHRVTLVDARDRLVVGLAKLWLVDGRMQLGQVEHPLVPSPRPNLRFLRAIVEEIDPAAKRVRTDQGPLEYDHLVVALGARLAPEDVPGLQEGAHNLYAPVGAAALHQDLARMRSGQRLVILVSSMPFKCPPAPYEAAILAKGFLQARGVDAEVVVASPEPRPLPVAGAACSATVLEWLDERGVLVRSDHHVERVDPQARRVHFKGGATLDYDVLAAVPPHRLPPVLQPLAGDAPWVPADAATLATRHADVWAIGDCNVVKLANGKPLVKAGVMAEGEALVVARNLAARLRGEPEAHRFDGKGFCYLELGDGLATEIRGEFYATPDPVLAAQPPTKAALAAKEAFLRERLARWLA